MGFISSLFPSASGVAHNGPQPPAPPAPVAGTPVAAPVAAPAPAEPQTAVSQLDKFTALWQTPTTADGKPAPIPANPLQQPVFNLDPQKVVASAQQMDFTAGITPETYAKISAGGPEAAVAFADAINTAVRQAVVGMTLSNGNVINNAMLENNNRITNAIPTHIKKAELLNMGSDDPVLSHPAIQPLVNSLKQMAFAKDPGANPAEINAQVAGLLRGMGVALAETDPTAVKQKEAKAAGEQDWSAFL